MIAWRTHLAIIVLSGMVAGSGCRRSRPPSALATLTETSGTVEAGRGGTYNPVTVGRTFSLGDAVRTGDLSSARLKFSPGRVMRLGERALVRFVSGGEKEEPALHVEFGDADIDGEGAFYVSTTRGLARLEPGTRLKVHAGTTGTRLDVLFGKASLLEAEGQAPIGPGEGLEISIGGASIERYKVNVGAAEWTHLPPTATKRPDAGRPADAAAGATPPDAAPVILPETSIRGQAGAGGRETAAGERAVSAVDVTLPAGETAMIHDRHAPVAIRVKFEQMCPTGGTVEVAGSNGSFKRPSQRAPGKAAGVIVLRPGRYRYRIACADGAAAAKGAGTLVLKKDGGTAPIPRTAPTNTIDADGRKYTVLYQNRLPTLTFVWPRAPGKGPYVLHLATDEKERQWNAPKAKHTLPSGMVPEGKHRWWFTAVEGQPPSTQTSLVVRFDNAAAAAQVQSPPDGGTWAENEVEVAGIAVEGSTAAIDGKPLTMDSHGRFRGQAPKPGPGERAIAVRLENPRSGVHYYVRRMAGAGH